MSEFCAFVVIMIWVNLRVSLETDHAYVQYAVAATLVSFFSVAVLPVWKYLSPGFLPYVIFMVALFLAYNYVLNTLTRALGHLSETSSSAAPTLKWETVQKIEDMRKAERKRSEAAKLKSLDADREEGEEEAKNVLGIVELIPPSSPPTHVSPTTPTRHMHLRRRSSVLEDSTCAPINNNNNKVWPFQAPHQTSQWYPQSFTRIKTKQKKCQCGRSDHNNWIESSKTSSNVGSKKSTEKRQIAAINN